MNSTTTSLELIQLIKWSCYIVQVRAVTTKNGTWNKAVIHRTNEDGKK